MNYKTYSTLHACYIRFFTTFFFIVFVTKVNAGLLISPDLSFEGEFGLDLNSEGPTAAQSGTFFSRTAGVDSSGAYINNSELSGNNPFYAILQNHGNGVIGGGDGFGGTAQASITPNEIGPSRVFADTDLGDLGQTQPLLIMNSSLTQAYQIFFSLSYEHSVSTLGEPQYIYGGSYAESDLEVLLNGNLIFEAEIISDSIAGNSLNKMETGNFGGELSDSGQFVFSIWLEAQELAVIDLDYTLQGEDYEPMTGMTGSGSYFLSVDDIQKVAEPGSMLLMLPLLFVLITLSRHKANRALINN